MTVRDRPSSVERETWDLFCRVVDNYGDVGIAWRLARQLTDEGRALRLFVEGLDVLAHLEPRIDPRSSRQIVDGIEVRSSVDAFLDAADVVVELLGCGLPDAYLDAMATRRVATVWIDYEHLSAEGWIAGVHTLPSPHPTRPLVKHFFYPGFGPRTGGLPIETGFDRRRRAFVDDPAAIASFRRKLDIAATGRHLSLFAYPDAPVDALFDALAAEPEPWSVVVPEGVLAEPIAAWLATHETRSHDALTVTTIPFVDQDDYDRLLWSCDLNCVRGEDSFVRAQLAARPFVWAAYRQADDVHLEKLAAFDDRYEASMQADVRALRNRWSTAWNAPRHEGHQGLVDAAHAWLACAPRLSAHAGEWAASLLSEPSLVERLAAFVAGLRRSSRC